MMYSLGEASCSIENPESSKTPWRYLQECMRETGSTHLRLPFFICVNIIMPKSQRQDIRQFLIEFFTEIDYQTSIEECLNAYILSRGLGVKYQLKSNETSTSITTSTEERIRLRNQISQELGVMKQMGLIGRARYGVYVKRT